MADVISYISKFGSFILSSVPCLGPRAQSVLALQINKDESTALVSIHPSSQHPHYLTPINNPAAFPTDNLQAQNLDCIIQMKNARNIIQSNYI